ncbi:prostasin-like [Dreissena polymorpha]|uniref:prostasin-like n=1 Tax=Dreissena polymorpha TaxID=45954 RepID=UPI002264D46C|nr:prostasin-like [Dreissena polymorpha]
MRTWVPYINGLHVVLIFLELRWCYTLDNKVFDGVRKSRGPSASTLGKTCNVLMGCKQENDDSKRVVGGSALLQGEWPWLVSMHFMYWENFTIHFCGATLIHPQWLLTAAHCFMRDRSGKGRQSDKNNWHVMLGEHAQGEEEGMEQMFTLDKIVTHPEFLHDQKKSILYDIALVKLSRPALMSEYVNTICIEPNYTAPDHSHCVTAG